MTSRTLEIDDFLFAGEETIPLHVTGTYHRGHPAHTPRGEYAPIDPPEPALFEIDALAVYDKAGVCMVPFPVSALTSDALERLSSLCVDAVER